MKLMLDMDGCFADMCRGFHKLVMPPGTPYAPPDDWGFKSWNAPEGAISKAWDKVREDPMFWGTLPPLGDAWETLKRIDHLATFALPRHEVYFVTHRFPGADAKFWTERWLQRYGVDNPTVIVGVDKGTFSGMVKPDIIVDDNGDYLWGAMCNSPDARGYLVRSTYSAKWEKFLEKFVTVVDSVGEVLDKEFPGEWGAKYHPEEEAA